VIALWGCRYLKVITTENYIKKFDLRTLVASANDIVEEAINEMEEVVMKSGHYA